jgi:Concanavalin A-like lectin/glucanases superfamily
MKGVFKSIDGRDRSITPFKAYKSWGFPDTGSLSTYGIDRFVAIKPNTGVFSGNIVTLDSSQVFADTGSYLVNVANGLPTSVTWYSLNHLYYKRAGQPYETFGNTDHQAIQRKLYTEASVFSIPQLCMGETLKPGSISISLDPTASGYPTINLVDDGNGNLIDTALSSSVSNQIFYLRLNESTYETDWSPANSTTYSTSNIQEFKIDAINKEINCIGKNIQLAPKPIANTWGNAAFFFNNSYVRIPNNDSVNFTQDTDFTLAFWYTNTCTDSETDYVVTKRTTVTGTTLNDGILSTGNVNLNKSQYPFEISYRPDPVIPNQGILSCKQSSGGSTTELTTTYYSNGTRNHIAFVSANNTLQLWVNGILVDSDSKPAGNIQNAADIFIGSLGVDSNNDGKYGISGAIDEFFIFNKGLVQSEILQLADTSLSTMATNTNIVGNVFYEHGIVVISDPRLRYGNSTFRFFNDAILNTITITQGTNTLSAFSLNFSSTVSMYEHEYLCRLNEDEFNFTLNPTIRRNDDVTSQIPKDIVSNPAFSPYITTIGLYNDKYELVAIAKLASPVKKRDTVDLNIVVRFDI